MLLAAAIQQAYDGDTLRAKKIEGGTTTYYLRSSVLGGQVVAEVVNGSWSRGYVYLGSQLLAIQQGVVKWVHQDPVAKSQRLTDAAGNITAGVELGPWGGETTRSFSSEQQPRKFTSYERDANGSDEAMMRRYNRYWSRFDQPDQYDGSMSLADPQSFNRYAYVQNDPVNFVDPSGLDRDPPQLRPFDPNRPRDPNLEQPIRSGSDFSGLLSLWLGGLDLLLVQPLLPPAGVPGSVTLEPPQTDPLPAREGAAISNALAALINALSGKISKNCQKNVIDKLTQKQGFNLADFVSYLGKGANFYNGLTSQAPVAGTVTTPQAANAGYGPGATVAGVFADTSDGLRTDALTSITSPTLLAFFRPSAISTSRKGVNDGNLGLLFHEGLHGYGGTKGGTSYFDQDLKSTFGLRGSGSNSISDYISRNCF